MIFVSARTSLDRIIPPPTVFYTIFGHTNTAGLIKPIYLIFADIKRSMKIGYLIFT